MGQTRFTAFLVALALSLKKKRVYGLVAICGGMTHLLRDRSALVRWFYPFKGYNYPKEDYRGIITWHAVAETLWRCLL